MSTLYQLYQQWNEQIKSLYDWQHHRVLSWLMIAIMVGGDVCLDRLGLNLPHETKPESVAQQFRRWLKNKAIDDRFSGDV